ncbi:ABC transporter ATP-binding protein [Micromonospora endophytica]|uniref:ABC transporter n=1 Tax=Micromonospora endophytica TaxID=515350 RepID=A0A2W2E8E0_9ACTN|nr:ABC transporter ATP-binding protein [Micromonospora endophytica]PZG01194.1 ABC transporter [Micromonospora endophytica]RIW45865.1 ABC transporter ATP-binding protein [Micromonospora endophytica]BCJ61864.1 putative ABC transporter, ATP-binding protein [Micromonospora endophytica]
MPSAESGGTPAIAVTDVEHRYGDTVALGPLNLAVPPGEFLVLVGASGCGKSTLLRLIAGFERPTTGTVLTGGVPPIPGRGAGLVFQQPRLFPWKTVGGNIELALRYAGQSTDGVDALLQRVGLPDVAKRRTWQISGGQQQRVAIARALAADRPLLLLDEPFAALDALTRERLQEDLRSVSAATGRTSIFVTHSVDEAVFLGSRVVVLSPRPGRIVLDLPIPLPRAGITPDDLRGLPDYAALRAEIGHAVRSEGASA